MTNPENLTIESIFGADGLIAKIKPGYEVRDEQIQVAQTVERAITEQRNALIEAGTGTGKSFALVVPAVLSGKRTVISTETNTLLDQYIMKDLPFLHSILGIPFSFAKAKGKNNFVCLAGETEILTWDGVRKISDCVGNTIRLIDGNGSWVEAPVKSYGKQRLWAIELTRFDTVKTIYATAEHRWFYAKGNGDKQFHGEITTQELQPGVKLRTVHQRNGAYHLRPSPFGIAHGIVFGDGSRFGVTKNGFQTSYVVLFNEKKNDLLKYFSLSEIKDQELPSTYSDRLGKRVCDLPAFFKDFPDLNEAPSYLYGWLAGYFATDGTMHGHGPEISSSKLENLEFVQKLCLRLGIHTHPIRQTERVGINATEASELYTIRIVPIGMNENFFLREKHRREWKPSRYERVGRHRWTVLSVKPTDRNEIVYCAEVPSTQSFALSDYILTGNCRHKIDQYMQEMPLFDYADAEEVESLIKWAANTESGDKSEPDFKFSDSSWQAIGCDDLCIRSKCPYCLDGIKGYSDCFACKARKAFLDADLVVTNHTLCLLNASIGGDAVLGSHEVLIFDEGHTLAEQSQNTFGYEIKERTMSSFAKYVSRMAKQFDMSLEYDATMLEYAEADFFLRFKKLAKQQMTFEDIPASIIADAKEFSLPVIREVDLLRKSINGLATTSDEDIKLKEELDDRARGHIGSIKGLFSPDNNWLPFVELTENGRHTEPRVTLNLKPIDVAPILNQKVFSQRMTTISASATLAVSGRFDFYKADTGMPDPICLLVDSPFNFTEQCTGYFPSHIPDPNAADYHTELAEEIEKLLIHTSGRAFVLFTSYRDLDTVHKLISGRLKYNILRQGDLPKPALIEQFKSDIHSVLLATRSFFTGVDIPGEALSCVMLTKAPFRPPSEPLFAAKCKLIKARGGNDFTEYAMPLMVNDLRQAFGRGIRCKTDQLLFAFLDSRAIKKPYFRMIMRSLPTMKVKTRLT
jgi:Rad3-related DNA helicase